MGSLFFKDAELGVGGDDGALVYRANDEVNYIETLCSYAGRENLIPKKDLKFATIENAANKIEKFISKFDIGCELGNPAVTALNGNDLNEVQKKIMNDDIGDILRAKKTRGRNFDSSTEVYYFEYPFVLNHLPVFGNDDPTVQYTGDVPLLAQNMGLTAIMSKSGIEELTMFGMLDRLSEDSGKAKIMGYDGIREALKKKFGDVILTDKYRVINIWMEYFPLIKKDSFNQVNVIPLWCCDFEINGKKENYTLRFNAVTGEEIS